MPVTKPCSSSSRPLAIHPPPLRHRSFSKGPSGTADASCTPLLEAAQLTPTQIMATADPIADTTATANQGGGTDATESDDEGKCAEADYKCIAADVSLTTYCLGKAVTPCPPGYACVGGSSSKPACAVATDSNSPAVVPPPECEGTLKCIDASSFCDNGTISACAEGFACTGDEGSAACTAAAPAGGGEPAAVTCSDPDQTCIAGADGGASTSYCIGGAVIPCDTGESSARAVVRLVLTPACAPASLAPSHPYSDSSPPLPVPPSRHHVQRRRRLRHVRRNHPPRGRAAPRGGLHSGELWLHQRHRLLLCPGGGGLRHRCAQALPAAAASIC